MSDNLFSICRPRPDVLLGTVRESDFAADLSQVLRGDAPDEYKRPELFFANTYPTKGLRNVLKLVALRLMGRPEQVASIFRLDTQFGGGKTHALIALSHAMRGLEGVSNADEFLEASLRPKTPIRVAAFDGENADPANGRRLSDKVRAFTPWGELAFGLGKDAGYRLVEASDKEGVAAGAETFRELIGKEPTRTSEDAEDDQDASGDAADEDLVEGQKRQALQFEERTDIASLLERVSQLPPDTKAQRLVEVLRSLRSGAYDTADGALLPPYAQAIVFTQYTDTLDYLRDFLKGQGFSILCFSGRGGEWLQPDGSWRFISREETRRRFRGQQADVLLCTDAAAEGLNFQFCGALVNFDAPWNPMRIEQRIGRVDRLGQAYEHVAVVNLLYEGTVETDVYRALRSRIKLFTSVVGRLQPILSALPARIAETTLAPKDERERARANLVASLQAETAQESTDTFDIDEILEATLEAPAQPKPPYGLEDLRRVLDRRELLPDGVEAVRTSSKEVFWGEPGRLQISVTTDPDFFEQHPESVEFWTPGSPVFPPPPPVTGVSDAWAAESLGNLLEE